MNSSGDGQVGALKEGKERKKKNKEPRGMSVSADRCPKVDQGLGVSRMSFEKAEQHSGFYPGRTQERNTPRYARRGHLFGNQGVQRVNGESIVAPWYKRSPFFLRFPLKR